MSNRNNDLVIKPVLQAVFAKTYLQTTLEIMKMKFKEKYFIESQFVIVDEKTNEIVDMNPNG